MYGTQGKGPPTHTCEGVPPCHTRSQAVGDEGFGKEVLEPIKKYSTLNGLVLV